MSKTGEIKLTLEQAKLANMNVWEYLMKICALLSSPIISQLEVELQEYMKQNQAANIAAQKDGRRIMDALVLEANMNARLRQQVQTCRRQIQEMQEHGQSVPRCPTYWIYQDFPALSELNKVEPQPLTVLLDHILHRYDLDKDEVFRKTLLSTEVRSLWQRNSKLTRNPHPQPYSYSNSTRPSNILATIPEEVEEYSHNTAENAELSNATSNKNESKPAPTEVYSSDYTRVVSGNVEDDLVLRLVKMCSEVNRDLTSESAIAGILRESVERGSQLEGAGYLVHRYKKMAKRRLKAAAEAGTNRESSHPSSTSDCSEPTTYMPHVTTQGTEPVTQGTLAVTSAEPEFKRTSFLANVAKFQNKFKGASLGTGHGQKRKTSGSSVCRGLQTKFSKTRMDTTLSALKRHVTKRHLAA